MSGALLITLASRFKIEEKCARLCASSVMSLRACTIVLAHLKSTLHVETAAPATLARLAAMLRGSAIFLVAGIESYHRRFEVTGKA